MLLANGTVWNQQLHSRKHHRLMNAEDAAPLLGATRRTICRWQKQGKMPERVLTWAGCCIGRTTSRRWLAVTRLITGRLTNPLQYLPLRPMKQPDVGYPRVLPLPVLSCTERFSDPCSVHCPSPIGSSSLGTIWRYP
jgi:hypothetical protein